MRNILLFALASGASGSTCPSKTASIYEKPGLGSKECAVKATRYSDAFLPELHYECGSVDCDGSGVACGTCASTQDCVNNVCLDKVIGDVKYDDESYSGNAQDYRGIQSVTVSGRTCAPWDQVRNDFPGNFPGAGLGGHHNYCRNPG
eukprot:gene81-89_t